MIKVIDEYNNVMTILTRWPERDLYVSSDEFDEIAQAHNNLMRLLGIV